MKKKICFVISTVFTAKAFLSDHIEHLAEEYDVFLVGNFTPNELPILRDLKISGFYKVEIPRRISLYKDFSSVIQLRSYLKKENFFAVHSVTPKAGLISALASKMANVPNRIHIFTGQVWYKKEGFMKHLLIFLDKIIAGLNTHILVDGEPQRQFLIQNGILKHSNSFVLGKGSISGVNIRRFQPNSEVRDKMQNELNLRGKIVFGFLGRMNKDKGIVELLTAFDRLVKTNEKVHLLFIGGDEENMMSTLPSYKNIQEGINFTNFGHTYQPEEVLQAVDVFCLPSHREGFGTSVLEASCMGIPVICSDTYGLMDSMIDDVTGLRHKVGDSDHLYLQMLKMATNEELRKTLGANAREYVLTNFSSEIITSEWIQFYNSLT